MLWDFVGEAIASICLLSESAKNKTETKEGHHPYEKADVGWAFFFTKSAGSKKSAGKQKAQTKN